MSDFIPLDLRIAFDPPVQQVEIEPRNAEVRALDLSRAESSGVKIVAARLRLAISEVRYGVRKALLMLRTDRFTVTFAPADALAAGQIWVEEYGVMIYPDAQADAPAAPAGLSKLRAIELAPEETFEQAAAMAQDFPSPTVLGLGRDNRVFLIDPRCETITLADSMRPPLAVAHIPIGRGRGARTDLTRRLDGGVLPILRADKLDGDIRYSATLFATFADQPLREENVAGVHFLIAEEGLGMPHTPEQIAERETARQALQARGQASLMLCYRLEATNQSSAPAYAFFYMPRIDNKTCFLQGGRMLDADGVWGELRCDGRPWEQSQVAILLAPGATATVEYRLLHRPIRGDMPWRASFDDLLDETRAYWQAKLDSAARLVIPESRIDDMARAGLLHLDLITYGERRGTLAATIGWYSPIGTESAPIIQFYDSMGWHDTARRCLQYFIDKQHDDGRFQNFGGYMLETGAALWSMGEHYRYTRDNAWVREISDAVVAACGWIMRHRHEDTPPGQPGAGLIKGKVADPEDHYHQFMLNAYQCLGLSRAAEMLRGVDAAQAAALADEAAAFREDIRRALFESMARSPLVPLGDGRWVPPGAPWVEAIGPGAFALDGQPSYTHEAVYARDSMLGPNYAIFCEILDPQALQSDFLVESHYEHMLQDGVAFSQPYYSRHPIIHLRRGETRAFLRSYYRAMAGLADRQTYSFWEHYFGASPHKTHEEGWFLMETRWMLYREAGDALYLCSGIPRAWLRHGQVIEMRGAQSYFGRLDARVTSGVDDGWIEARVRCPQGPARGLQRLVIRLPHPHGRKARAIDGAGEYDPLTETVRLAIGADGEAWVRLRF